MPTPQSQPGNARSSSPILIAVAWLVVILPTAWGLSYTVRNALAIFDRTPAPQAATQPQ
jgi:hypothetical protein